jgi:hypothetical protein
VVAKSSAPVVKLGVSMASPPWIVSDEVWELVEPLLPVRERRVRYSGRQRLPDRECLCGILFGHGQIAGSVLGRLPHGQARLGAESGPCNAPWREAGHPGQQARPPQPSETHAASIRAAPMLRYRAAVTYADSRWR